MTMSFWDVTQESNDASGVAVAAVIGKRATKSEGFSKYAERRDFDSLVTPQDTLANDRPTATESTSLNQLNSDRSKIARYVWKLRQRTHDLEEQINATRQSLETQAAAVLTSKETQFLLSEISQRRRIEASELSAIGLAPSGWLVVAMLVNTGLIDIEGSELVISEEGDKWARVIKRDTNTGAI